MREDKKATDVVREQPAAGKAGGWQRRARTRKRSTPPRRARTATRHAAAAARQQQDRKSRTDAASIDTVAGVKLSHPDKQLFPEAKLTKRDLAHYYETIADWILPHLRGRPLALVRCPDGWSKQCFFQKHADKSVNAAVTRVEVPEGKGTATYFAANSLPALVALVQWGVVELHPWGSRAPKLDRPDRLIFDFDPDDGVSWKEIVEGVGVLRALLDDLGLEGFLKTTGGKGLHVVVPIRPTLDWDAGERLHQGGRRSPGRHFPRSLYRDAVQGAAQGQDLHRLPAQCRRRDRDRAVRASAPASQRAGFDADRMERACQRCSLRSFQRPQCPRAAARLAQGSMGRRRRRPARR